MLPKTRIKHILFIALTLVSLWGLIHAAIVIREGKPFKRNDIALSDLVDQIRQENSSASFYSNNECRNMSLKYRSGPKTCSTKRYMLFSTNTVEFAEKKIKQVNDIIDKTYPLKKVDHDSGEEHEWYYEFSSNGQYCSVSYRYFPIDKPGFPFGEIIPNVPNEKYSGLVAYLICSAEARWNYYPQR